MGFVIERNVKIAYFLAMMKNSWFWLGIWIFYYLRFTNYGGVGLIETILIATLTLMEIPTGAVADLIGKKKALILAFLFELIGGLMMAMAPNFSVLAAAVFVMCIGGALYSGTLEALVYDSLKQEGNEKKYDRAISKINSIGLLTPAICGAAGGFLYLVEPRLPFFANAAGYGMGLMLSFWLTEPMIDTEKFNFANFISQSKQGLFQLTKTVEIRRQIILILSIGFIVVVADEMLNSFLGFEFGFDVKQLGVLTAVIYVVSAAAAQLTPWFRRELGDNYGYLVVGGLIATSLIVSPAIGIIAGGITLAFRSSLQAIFGGMASVTINNNSESKYRATTISTFNMIKNIPYVLSAYFLGSLADRVSARWLAAVLGIVLLITLVPQFLWRRVYSYRKVVGAGAGVGQKAERVTK